MTKSILFVVGMHRSGTSLVTKSLEVVGVELGTQLIPAADDNPKGFFEDEDCVKLNEAILASMDLRWDIPTLMLEQDLSSQSLLPYVKDAAYLLKTKLKNSNYFALKDPRFCLLLPVWIAAAKMVNIDPSFVITVRNPLEVAHSLWNRNQFEYQKGLDLWMTHNFSLIDFLLEDSSKRIVVSYENLLSNPQQQLSRLAKFVNKTATIETYQKSIDEFSANFVDIDLAHSQSDGSDLTELTAVNTQLIELYQVLDGFANGQWSKQKAHKVHQSINPLAIESSLYRNQLRYFNKDIHQALGKQYHQLEDKFKEDYADLRSQATEYKITVEQKQQYIERLQAQSEQKIQDLEGKLSQSHDKNAELESDLQQLSGIVEQKENYIQELSGVIEQKQHSIQELNDQLNLLQSARAAAVRRKQRELFYAEKQVATIAARNTDLLLQCDKLTELCDGLNSDVEQTDQHLQGAITRINDIQKSLSYAVGRLITWPARKPYDVVLEPILQHPQNIRLLGQLAFHAVRHPVKSAQMLRWELIRNAYITFFKDPGVANTVVDHYVRVFEGEKYQSGLTDSNNTSVELQAASVSYPEPDRVSIFVINFNGRQHLTDLLMSLQAQNYHDYEIIVVDNGSKDDSVEYIQQAFPEIRVIALPDNTGFAEANNIAAEAASGRYFCLLNNDAEVAPDWLSSMVNCITQSDKTGAVGSKILFWKKFINIELTIQPASLKRRVGLNIDALESSASVYQKLFFGSGWKDEQLSEEIKTRSFDKNASLWFPVCEGQTKLRLVLKTSSKKSVKVKVSSSVETTTDLILKPDIWTELTLDFTDKIDHPGLCYLINNAGSEVDKLGQVQDRGFGVPDQGQYDVTETVTALCGGAMLIRPEVLANKPLFGKDFFAYFEDTDLSLRIREQGYDLVYCPQSVVYHKHASTSQEHSPFFRFYVNRNRILFLALHYPESIWKKAKQSTTSELNHQQHYFKDHSDDLDEQQFAQKIPQIFDDWQALLPKIESHCFFERNNRFPKLAVYNNFWHTLGGGEHHACVIAQALEQLGPVDLVSENDFSIEALEQQFNIRLKHCRKRLVTSLAMHHNPATTAYYDVFVNSTYSSDLVSHAQYAYYVVSFPYKIPAYPSEGKAFLKSYDVFLANSAYTAGWVKQWWDVDNCEVLYPSVAMPDINFDHLSKTKNILHVGRFFRSGHNKKQLELVRVFKQLMDSGKIEDDWKLTLVGQVDPTQQTYLDEVLEEAHGYPIEVLNNIALESLKQLYLKSAIYWHATGLGESTERNPERNEHFGISTVEAMSYGCVPIVINAGGQPESVSHEDNGFLFNNEKELEAFTIQCMQLFSHQPDQYETLSKQAFDKARHFSRNETKKVFHGVLSDDLLTRQNGFQLL